MGLRDVETGKPITGHGGTVGFNPHRKKWVMIALQTFGRSMLGEVWFAEADTLLGPWGYARRIVTHDRYSFYNIKHHPYFSAGDGRWLYFEGTYTAMFSGAKSKTPRYDYNQIMYRLALDDPRLALPVPVYRLRDGTLAMSSRVQAEDDWERVIGIPFFALDRPGPGLVPLDELGFGLDPNGAGTNVPLYRDPAGRFVLEPQPGMEPLARVWANPLSRLILAPAAQPAR